MGGEGEKEEKEISIGVEGNVLQAAKRRIEGVFWPLKAFRGAPIITLHDARIAHTKPDVEAK